MEPSASIAIIETDLRRLINEVFLKAMGENWQIETISGVLREKLLLRYQEEFKRRAPANVTNDLLDYCHLYELRNFIEKNWHLFSEGLGKQKEFAVLMDKVEDFRNAPAHSRELLPFEVVLLDGIAGEIRTKVTIYLSKSSVDSMHYPIIESISDSFGNSLRDIDGDGMSVLNTGLHLQVNQTVEFSGRAWDPQGRDITWDWGPFRMSSQDSVIGTDVKFTWTPTYLDVGRLCFVEIRIASSGIFHRRNTFDHRVSFQYTVDPPISE